MYMKISYDRSWRYRCTIMKEFIPFLALFYFIDYAPFYDNKFHENSQSFYKCEFILE